MNIHVTSHEYTYGHTDYVYLSTYAHKAVLLAGKDEIAVVMRRRAQYISRPRKSLYSPPSKESVTHIVSRLRWENEMWEKFWSISVYIIVTSLILTIVYGPKDPMSIHLTTNVNNMFITSTFTNGQRFNDVSADMAF